jgi:hypothetical protein
MQMLRHQMAVSHRHGHGLVPEDRLQSGQVARALGEQRGEMVPKIMAPERDIGATSDLAKASSEARVSGAIIVPEHDRRGDVPGCAD